MRRVRGAVGVLVVLGTLLVGTPAAQAHADLLSSNPAGGSALATPPTELRLTYSEAPDPSLSAVELLTSGASPVPTGTPQVVDRTTLPGTFDFDLRFTDGLTADARFPSLFTAVQEQLGLKLEFTRAPAAVAVIDSAQRPTDN